MSPDEQKEKQKNRRFNLIMEMRLLKKEVEFFTNGTREYRESLDKKFDKIFSWLEKLPCSERKALYNQVKVMWGLIVAIVLVIVGEYLKRK